MISHRAIDHPLGALKDDLTVALQRLQLVLEPQGEHPADPVVLESMVDVLEQLHSALAALHHQEAASLLEEIRIIALALARDNLAQPQTVWQTLQRAIARLADYLHELLEKETPRPTVDLAMATDELRSLRQLIATDNALLESAPQPALSEAAIRPAPIRNVLDKLKQLHLAVATDLDSGDNPELWAQLQGGLRETSGLLTTVNWTDAAALLTRLERMAAVLAEGATAHYGPLVSGVFAEVLATLGYYLEPLSLGRQPSATVLHSAEEHLTQLETLLEISATDIATPEDANRNANADLELLEWPALDLTLAATPPVTPDESAPATKPTTDSNAELDTLEWPDWFEAETAASATATPVVQSENPEIGERPLTQEPEARQVAVLPTDGKLPVDRTAETLTDSTELAFPVSPETARLADSLGLTETDPEFLEVFFEEARGELAAICEQLAVWRAHPQDKHVLTGLRRAFHTLKGSGRMVGATALSELAWNFEVLLNHILEGRPTPTPHVAVAIEVAEKVLEPLVGTVPVRGGEMDALQALIAYTQALQTGDVTASLPAALLEAFPPTPVAAGEYLPSPERGVEISARAAAVAAVEIDPEFVEVFFEEACGELATIRDCLAVWQAHPDDQQPLTTIRRAFHTLKGSGRMVGQTTIGEFAWCFENLLNRVLENKLAAVPAMAVAISAAIEVLQPLVGATPLQGDETAILARLTAQVEELLQGPPPAVTVPAPAKPAEPEISVSLEAAPVPAEPTPAVEPRSTALVGAAEVDLELIQVFQYEAAEILDASDVILQRLSTAPASLELLNDLRRGMHTLKGSSRMAGLLVIGDLAHAAESVLDALGKSLAPVSPPILDALQHTLDRLNRMLAEISSGTSPAAVVDLIEDLHAMADLVARGEPIAEVLPVPSVEPVKLAPIVLEPHSLRAMTELDQELAQVFQTEAAEILDASDIIVQQLGIQPENTELLNDLRREMHTLKGSARMTGFMVLGDLAHAAESVLDALGKGTLQVSPAVLEGIQQTLDRLQKMLADLRNGIELQPQQDLVNELRALLGGKAEEPPKPTVITTVAAPMSVPAAPGHPAEKPATAAAPLPADTIRVSAALLNTLVNQMGESSIFRARIDQGVGTINFSLNELDQTIARLRRQVINLATQAESRIQSRQDQDQDSRIHQLEFDPLELDRFTELQQVTRSLMEIADDLGNIGSTLSEHTRDITSMLDQQGKVNKEIQRGLMRTGMVRFGSVIPRLRRVVRQSAQELGKRAELLVGGEEAEVDRTVLENMLAPLEHMLRNSLAHGVESPEQRRALGKSEIGTITLSLRREGAELVLELGDDGIGLNFEAIRAKGEEKGLLLPGQPATQEELIALLLRPGFSTAAKVTQISGRGVGMDVVNDAIRAMRGALLIQTEPERGTRFTIRLPFSLAVTQALLVQAGSATYAVPLLSIELVTRLKEAEFQAYLSGEQIQHPHGERPYPIHNLGILIGSERILPFEEVADRRPPTLLFRSAEASAALQVEAILGNQEIIVKPVGPQFNRVLGISGATVLGDGRVVVVLELAALIRNIGSQAQKQAESRALRLARQEARQEKISVMVIDDSITMRKVTARILERHNIKAITAKDGMDAVALLQEQVPDLAILDIEMPRMDGFEVVGHVRNQAHLRHLPIIMVTSRGGEKHRERAFKLGVNDYLTKPYQEEQLMQSVRKILGERALELIT